MVQRFYAHQYGDDAYDFAVHESPGGGRTEPISVLSWLTHHQAHAIADFLNDVCGDGWHKRHPEWFDEAKKLRAAMEKAHPPPWKDKSDGN